LHPEKILALYKYIIEVSNSRLLDSGKELASIYEMNMKIDELSKFGEQGFRDIVDHISKTISVDYILLVEQHPVVKNLLVYKYDSHSPYSGPINQKVAGELQTNELAGEKLSTGAILGTEINDNLYILPLKNRENLKGYFILGKKNKETFADIDIRMMNNIAPLLGSMIENNQTLAEKKAMSFKQGNF